ncbi:unnamed protein product [Rotaria sp. Silwood2]|nr:unnamed protein product [Rotaria sp. Silwood2]CAF3117201.1 unnamed protein product [Rotaria sp. Silwood2]CAF3425830.1 unnamed protein product [Rotaria sp. Silwood2]
MWFQLAIEVLMKMKEDNLRKSIEDLVLVCKRHYAGNGPAENTLKQLEENYTSLDAVWWYTGETFIYRILNRALKRQDFEILILFRFLIRDLHEQLAQEQKIIQKNAVITVYRGQSMTLDELESFRTNETKFVAFNKLLSTSLSRRQAISYANAYNQDSTKTLVLFEIEADTRLKGAQPFASVSHLSQYKMEEEVLFMLGTIFKILDISRHENEKLWIIKMVLSGDQDNELKEIFETMKKQIPEETNIGELGNIFANMGQYDKATRYYKRLFNLLPESHEELSLCYCNLGHIFLKTYAFQHAYLYFQKGLDLESQNSSPNKRLLAGLYNGLGCSTMDPEQRLQYHKQSLNIMGTIAIDPRNMAGLYANIGQDYFQKKDYDSALHYYNEAMKIQNGVLPEKHPDRTLMLTFLGELLQCKKDYGLALDNYKKALEIQSYCVPHSIDVARTFKCIADLHDIKEEFSEALSNYNHALEVYEKFPLNTYHSEVEETLWRISALYANIGNYSLAIEGYERLLYIQLSYIPSYDLTFVDTYKRLGATFVGAENVPAALDCFYKALSILERNFNSSDHPEIVAVKEGIRFMMHNL